MKKPLKEYGFEYLYSKMTENQFKFNFLDARFSMTYTQGKKSTDLKGQLRVKNDSLTWLSFSPALGIEAARIVLTNDSIKFINRLSKTYFIGRYNLVDSLIGTTIDYAILQAMIIGNDLNQYDVNKYRSSIDGDLYKITIQERQKIKKELKSDERKSLILIQNIWLDPENFKIRKVELKELADNNRRLQVFYNNFQLVEGELFPSQMRIEVSSTEQIVIDVNFGKVQIELPVAFPFKIPDKYDKLF
jgi:outer membrane lipoprotein-sorting protein